MVGDGSGWPVCRAAGPAVGAGARAPSEPDLHPARPWGGEASLLVRNDGAGPSLLQAWVDGGRALGTGREVTTPFWWVPP